MSSEPPAIAPLGGPVWHAGRAAAFMLLKTIHPFRRSGREHIPASGGTLIVCNHLSNSDPFLVGLATLPRRTRFMAKVELFSGPLAGVFRRWGAFPVRRGAADREAIRTARDLLAAGEAVVMFPEGTRSADGRLRPAFPGAGLLALEPGVTVVPAAVWGSQRLFRPTRIVFGPPVDLSGVGEGSRSHRAQQATRILMRAIADLVPAAGGPPQVVPDGEPSSPAHERSARPADG
ncbi:MAG: lysophospholipid acyltransferase family protein [Actinomycetota bacterium]